MRSDYDDTTGGEEQEAAMAEPGGLEGLEGLEGMDIDPDVAALLASLSDEPLEEAPSEPAPAVARPSAASASAHTAIGTQAPALDAKRETPTVSPAQFVPFQETAPVPAPGNIDLILEVSLRVTVELGRTTMSIRDVLELGPGSVIELDRLAGEPVDILINDHLIARGEVVVVDESFGVRVTDIVTPAKRVASLK